MREGRSMAASEKVDAGVTLDVISFSAAVLACKMGGQWKPALSLLKETGDAGVTLDVISFSPAVVMLKAGDAVLKVTPSHRVVALADGSEAGVCFSDWLQGASGSHLELSRCAFGRRSRLLVDRIYCLSADTRDDVVYYKAMNSVGKAHGHHVEDFVKVELHIDRGTLPPRTLRRRRALCAAAAPAAPPPRPQFTRP